MHKNIKQAIRDTSRILDIWLPRKIKYDLIVGLSVGITHNGKLVYRKGFGYADISSKKKATPETNYRIASISKMFTTIALLQLVENGKIQLDDPVVKYVKWFKAKNSKINSENITIRQMLSHTAGVFRDGTTSHWTTDKFPNKEELKKSFSSKSLILENSTKFKYSNFGFAVLGQVIEKVSGIPYEKYVKLNIIKELQMKNTHVDLTKNNYNSIATGYGKPIPDEQREICTHCSTNAYAPAAGFISNVDDLALLLSLFSTKKNNRFIINKESLKRLTESRWDTGADSIYGVGTITYNIGERKITGHSGGFPGFRTRITIDKENDIGVITLTNTTDSSAPAINSEIFETIYNLLDSSTKFYEEKNKLNSKIYEGTYRNRWGEVFVVGIGNKLIAFDHNDTSPLKNGATLVFKSKDNFIINVKDGFDSHGEIAKFIFGENNKVERLVWGSQIFIKQ